MSARGGLETDWATVGLFVIAGLVAVIIVLWLGQR
jgi:hypothetical protein